MPNRFPLSWPATVPRTLADKRRPSKFDKRRNVSEATKELQLELNRLGARDIVLSTNVELNSSGEPHGGRRAPADPGVAVYFALTGKPYCFPCDRWATVPENIYAIAKHIEAMRGQERWGVGSIEQAFRGYAALPEPATWRTLLRFNEDDAPTLDQVETSYRTQAQLAHPDRPGGSHDRMAELNRAIEEARKELGA